MLTPEEYEAKRTAAAEEEYQDLLKKVSSCMATGRSSCEFFERSEHYASSVERLKKELRFRGFGVSCCEDPTYTYTRISWSVKTKEKPWWRFW